MRATYARLLQMLNSSDPASKPSFAKNILEEDHLRSFFYISVYISDHRLSRNYVRKWYHAKFDLLYEITIYYIILLQSFNKR